MVGWVCDVEVEIMPPGGAPPGIVEVVFGGTMETSIAKPFGEARLKQVADSIQLFGWQRIKQCVGLSALLIEILLHGCVLAVIPAYATVDYQPSPRM